LSTSVKLRTLLLTLAVKVELLYWSCLNFMNKQKKIAIQIIIVVLILSLVFGLLDLYASQSHTESNNEIHFTEISNDSFKQVPETLIDYTSSKAYIDFVLRSIDLDKKNQNIIGLIESDERNVILIESDGKVTELISDNNGSVISKRELELEVIQTKEISNKNGYLNEKTTVQFCEFDLPAIGSDTFEIINAIKITHENWEDSLICMNNRSKYVCVSGIYLVDVDDNIIVSGKTSALANCPILSIRESKTEIQNDKVVAVLSNSATWKSKGLGFTSKSTRETQISFDRSLNIETWVVGDSWIGF